MKTRNQAIRYARQNIGQLYPSGSQWRFIRRDLARNANWESVPRDHAGAQAARAQALVESALDFLGLPPVQYTGGAWTDYVPQIDLEIQIFTAEDGERFASVRCAKTGNGADFYASGQEVGWVDNNSLFLNCDWLTVAHARKSAAQALKGKGEA